MATQPQYTAQPILEYTQLTTTGSNTARDGSGTVGTTIFQLAAGPAVTAANGVGKRIIRVVIAYTGASSANVVRFFISNDNGTTKRLICEKIIPAITPSTSVAAFRTEVSELTGLILPGRSDGTSATNCILYASTDQNPANNINVTCESGTL